MKISQISFFLLDGTPLDKNRSSTSVYRVKFMNNNNILFWASISPQQYVLIIFLTRIPYQNPNIQYNHKAEIFTITNKDVCIPIALLWHDMTYIYYSKNFTNYWSLFSEDEQGSIVYLCTCGYGNHEWYIEFITNGVYFFSLSYIK